MNRFISIVVLSLLAFSAKSAIVSSNLLTLTSISANSTNTGSAVLLGSVTPYPSPTFTVQTVGTGGTNGSGGYILIGTSTNTANMAVVGYYSATNDTISSVTLSNSGTLNLYVAFQAYNTTNIPISIGAQLIQNK